MSSLTSHPAAVAPAPPPEASPTRDEFQARLSALYALAQRSNHVFASPLGPFLYRRQSAYLPRFVFFGPGASDESWRVAFLAGFDHRELRASHALLGFVEDLAQSVEDGHGLNLTFFPIANAAGFFLGAPPRPLASLHWGRAHAPELDLLEKDARLRAYHGFVRVESAAPGDDEVSIRVRAPAATFASPDVELISSENTDPFPVRFELGPTPAGGPLSIADDLPFGPFELTLRVPPAWPAERYAEAVRTILGRFVLRYRALQAYGQHL